MRVNDSAVTERNREQGNPEFQIQPITPSLVAQLALARAKAREERAPDPLAALAAKYEYRIAPHDVLQVTVWEHPELTLPAGSFRGPEENGLEVEADGTMFYPYVGLVQVAGKTVLEVRDLLAHGLKKAIEDPQVAVRVAFHRGKRVEVTGEVKMPSTLPVGSIPMRVSDALVRAGGLVPESDPSHVTLMRGGEVHVLDLTSFYEEGDLKQNWLLVDGDIVHVGHSSRSQVFVFGEVKKAGTKAMSRGRMSLAQALGDSEGFDHLSMQPSGIYVFRERAGKPSIYRLDAGSADALVMAAGFPLEPRDVVFVAANDLARFSRVMSQILPTVLGIWEVWDILYRSGVTFR
jgi:polysaccharide export outer membrane protein